LRMHSERKCIQYDVNAYTPRTMSSDPGITAPGCGHLPRPPSTDLEAPQSFLEVPGSRLRRPESCLQVLRSPLSALRLTLPFSSLLAPADQPAEAKTPLSSSPGFTSASQNNSATSRLPDRIPAQFGVRVLEFFGRAFKFPGRFQGQVSCFEAPTRASSSHSHLLRV
jgi:hypothetical protein